jgi:hypothetical protein
MTGSFQTIDYKGASYCVSLRGDGSVAYIARNNRLLWDIHSRRTFGPILKYVVAAAQNQAALIKRVAAAVERVDEILR